MRRALSLLLLGLAGCTPALTEIVVVVDSDIAVPSAMDRIEIRVSNDVATTLVAAAPLATTGDLPATVGLRPQQDTSASVTIVAVGMLAGSQIVSSEVRTHFLSGRRIVLQMFLSNTCRGIVCPRGQTCRAGLCADSTTVVDPATLPAYTGHIPRDAGMDGAPHDAGDAGSPGDAGDAGTRDTGPPPDAGGDAGCASAAACDDGMFCNGAELCVAGACVAGVAPSCDDLVACTTDSCSGSCTHTPNDAACTAVAGGHCDATNGCEYPTCDATTCHDDAATCTHATCMGATCLRIASCAAGQTCCAGTCVADGCNDGNLCTNDSCDTTLGCVHTANASSCDDANACTIGDLCSVGACAGGAPRICNDSNGCTTDTCDAVTGCVYAPNTATCDDANPCTTGDHCAGGACVSGSASCDDGIDCTNDACGGSGCTHTPDDSRCTAMASGTCSTTLGCQYPTCTPATCMGDASMCIGASCSGSTCNRASLCTGSQICCAGACVGAGCDDANPCTTDACGSSGCTHTANAFACDDGDACTTGDYCAGGSCRAGTRVTCSDDGNDCTDDVCAGGSCTHPYKIYGAACEDNSLCTSSSACNGSGSCIVDVYVTCNSDPTCAMFFPDCYCDNLLGCQSFPGRPSCHICP